MPRPWEFAAKRTEEEDPFGIESRAFMAVFFAI